jgi:tetratricopeptide (TPR) repeat protein
MSLLIKALDKAQEQAQAAKEKKDTEKMSLDNDVAQGSLKKATKSVKTSSQSKSSKTTLAAADPQALSFEITRPNIDLALAESVTSASAYLDKALTLSPKEGAPAEAPALKSESANAHVESITSPSAGATSTTPSTSPSSAANMFNAKRIEATNQNAKLAFLAATALLLLFAIGGYFYWQLNSQPAIILPERPLQQAVVQNQATQAPESAPKSAPENQPTQVGNAASAESSPLEITSASSASEPSAPAVAENQDVALPEKVKNKANKAPMKSDTYTTNSTDDEAAGIDVASLEATTSKANPAKSLKAKSKQVQPTPSASIASDSARIQVTKGDAKSEVNPTVMRAYEAYNAGKDTEAQQLYKQVLQRDVRNIDALLGLGAIASKQGRIADANGWYGKVLELEPRNAIAQAALINHPSDSQNNTPSEDTESRIKTMLAKQPDDANLHAALGNYYADKNQWANAQQAYFDAYRLNSSADNAFNLAVSLDQMRKPKLALPYYQRALEQADGASNIDKAALQARISAIQ